MAAPDDFAAALKRYDMSRLRAAFEAAKTSTGESYDRTVLNRWLDGSVPTRRDFVRRMADELDDESLFETWQAARSAHSPSQARSVVSRFQGLTAAEKDHVFHEIRGDYLAEFPSVRSRLAYRIEIDDPDDPDDDHLWVTVTYSWDGDIPADATIDFVSEYADLTSAYEDRSCAFREDLPFEPDRLQTLLEGAGEQVLSITPLGPLNPRPSRHVGRLVTPGRFEFTNAEATNAAVRFDFRYPYPKNRPVFFLRWGQYQVPDTVSVTLVLRSRSASNPDSFPFMPPGRQAEYTSTVIRSNELSVSLGTGNTVLGEGDGVVLFWTQG